MRSAALFFLLAATAKTQTWTSIGPKPSYERYLNGQPNPQSHTTGRITSVAVDPDDPQHWLAGAAHGGVWETLDSGHTWTPITESAPTQTVGALAFAPGDPRVIYAGTGEANMAAYTTAGLGILKSTDAGSSWTLAGQSVFGKASIISIRIDPSDANIVLAASTRGSAGRLGEAFPSPPPYGIYRSTDGGANWVRTLTGRSSALEVHPADFDRQYAGMGEPGSANIGNGVYRSLDAGRTWTLMKGPWTTVAASTGRISIAISPSRPDTVYAGIQLPSVNGNIVQGLLGLFRSDNAWDESPTWTLVPMGPTAPAGYCADCYYANVISVDPFNPDIVFAGGRRSFWRCTNCAESPVWVDIAANTSVHPDHHAIAWAGERLILGNDGGVYSTANRGATWQQHNTDLSAIEFFSGALHPTRNDRGIAGSQDNGSHRWSVTTGWSRPYNIGGRIEGEVALSRSRPDSDYAGVTEFLSNITRTRDLGDHLEDVSGSVVKGPGRAVYAPPFKKCPYNDDVFLVGADRLWRTDELFTAVAPSWSSNSPAPGNFITAIAFSPADETCNTYVYGTDGNGSAPGRIFLTTDGGRTWTDLDPARSLPRRGVLSLAMDPARPEVLYAAFSGYNDWTPGKPGHLFRIDTASTQVSWRDVGPPADLPHNVITIDPANSDRLYVGTDAALWRSADGGASWVKMGPDAGMPNCPVYDIQINPDTGVTAAFTFGRGAYLLVDEAERTSGSTRGIRP